MQDAQKNNIASWVMCKFGRWVKIDLISQYIKKWHSKTKDPKYSFIIGYTFGKIKNGYNANKYLISQRSNELNNWESLFTTVSKLNKSEPKWYNNDSVKVELLFWRDGFNYSNHNRKESGSIDVIRYVILNWNSEYASNANENQYLFGYVEKGVDIDSVKREVKLSLRKDNSKTFAKNTNNDKNTHTKH